MARKKVFKVGDVVMVAKNIPCYTGVYGKAGSLGLVRRVDRVGMYKIWVRSNKSGYNPLVYSVKELENLGPLE